MTALTGVSAIMVRELRGRMRSRKAFIFLTFYLAILAGLFYLSIAEWAPRNGCSVRSRQPAWARACSSPSSSLRRSSSPHLPRRTPQAPSARSARSRRTTSSVVTPITSLSIAVGKLMSGLAYLLILVLASIPVASLGFFFGGVEPTIFLPAYLVLIAGAIGLGSVGVFFSALLKRTQPASIATYLCLVAGTVGSLFGGALWYRLTDDQASRPPEALFYFTPYFAQADVFCELTADPGCVGHCPATRHRTTRSHSEPTEQRRFPLRLPPPGPVSGSGTACSGSVLAVVMLLGAARFISPTHPWRPGEAQPAHTSEAPG